MKKLILIIFAIISISMMSCDDNQCKDAIDRHSELTSQLMTIRAEQQSILDQEEGLNLDDDDQLNAYMMLEDELAMLAIQQALLEIEQESIEKNNFMCF